MKSPPASKYGYVSAVTSGAEVTDGMNFFYLGTDFSILSFETNPETDTNAPAMLWFPKGDQWHESGYIGGNAVWSGDYYPISESAVTRFQQHCRDRFAGSRPGRRACPTSPSAPTTRPNLLDIEREAYDRIIKTVATTAGNAGTPITILKAKTRRS